MKWGAEHAKEVCNPVRVLYGTMFFGMYNACHRNVPERHELRPRVHFSRFGRGGLKNFFEKM